MSDEPPILPVGTAVSAKYKGAFCEAKVSRVFPQIRYRVSYKEPNQGTDTLKEEHIKATGPIRVGRSVLAWHHGQKIFLDALVTRIQDQSQYTVVFDDGDITTLRRNYLCLKSGRHFNESETLDQLPLTHPEHFSNPVVGGRSRRRNRNRGEDSEGEHEEADPEMERYTNEVGRVVWGENLEKKRNRDWPPGLIMLPKNPKVLNTKEEFLIRSFKDDRFYNVPKKEVIEFNKEVGEKLEKTNTPFYIGVQKALKYLNTGELPANWEKHFLFNSDRLETDAELNFTDSSDDEPCEEKDRFVAQLYKFLEEAGTPLNKTPSIGGEDVDLYRLFSVVNKLGGYNKVSNHNKWKTVAGRLKFGNGQSVTNQVKQVYKKCLLSFEAFYKTLGVTMLNHTKSSKKNKGRSLIRDKDRSTPINSPRPDKEEETHEKKEEEKPAADEKEKPKRRSDVKEEKKKKEAPPPSEISESSSDIAEQAEAAASKDTGRPKRFTEVKSWAKEKKTPKAPGGEKVKAIVEKLEEQNKKEEDKEKGQQTRSKTQLPKTAIAIPDKKTEPKVTPVKDSKENKETKDIKEPKENKETKDIKETKDNTKGQIAKVKKFEDDKDKVKRARKRSHIESEGLTDHPAVVNINIGDKLKVYYGPSIESKITYEAKVVEIDKEGSVPLYLVHYTGWNTRYDEWIGSARVAENLSAATKAKRLKQGATTNAASANASKTSTPAVAATVAKVATKKRRNVSVTRRTSVNELPRSTTPLSSTSNSSRPKTPATPATRSTTRSVRQEQKRTRRTSIQTDTSVHTDTESPASESEPELTRTRSGGKSDEPEVRTYKKRVPKMPVLTKAIIKPPEDDDDTEKEEEPVVNVRPKRTRKLKRTPEKLPDESDDDSISLPKGRDFDLNQIRSELKGFSKAVTVPSLDSGADKDTSSDDSGKPLIKLHITAEEDEDDFDDEKEIEMVEEKEQVPTSKPAEESSSCEDIYEFKEPEPFEFETRSALTEDKGKKRLPRFYEDMEKSPSKVAAVKSPARSEQNAEMEKIFLSVKTNDSEEEEEEEEMEVTPKLEKEDPFDKLVESPSFNLVRVADINKPSDSPPKLTIMIEQPLALFDEPPDPADDCSRDMELSDTESQTQPIFTTRSEEVFSDAFTKSSSEQNTLDLEFSKSEDRNVDDEIQASIQRVIEQTSSTDDDTRDALLQVNLPIASYQAKKREMAKSPSLLSELADQSIAKDVKTPMVVVEKSEDNPEKSAFGMLKRLSPMLPNADKDSPSLLETISLQSQIKTCPSPPKIEDCGEVTAIAAVIKENVETPNGMLEAGPSEETFKKEVKVEELKDEEFIIPEEDDEANKLGETKLDPLSTMENSIDSIPVKAEDEEAEMDVEVKDRSVAMSPKEENASESKKRRKVISRPFIESDSDSSNSDNLVIARSDDESQTNSIVDTEKELKDNWDSNMSAARLPLDDSKTVQEEERNFNFEKMPEKDEKEEKRQEDNNDTKSVSDHMDIEEEEEEGEIKEQEEEEEPDSHLHAMLLCEETIPRSPAPATETTVEEPVRRSKSALEMPFASVPGSSNNKSMLLNPEPVKLHQSPQMVMSSENVNSRDTSAVLMNTPPSTPESTISNLSPRDNNGGLSPDSRVMDNTNTCDNDYLQKRRDSNKMSSYSEDDSQMACDPPKKDREDSIMHSTGRKRRRSSYRANDLSSAKRGRRPTNRSRHNSDSEEDTSDHSLLNSNIQSRVPYNRGSRSERPLKYDFRANLDGMTDSNQRINHILQKMDDLRKVYVDVKAELADIERRRKKIKRRQREALKPTKQVLSCA